MNDSNLSAQFKSSRLSMSSRAGDIAAVLAHQQLVDGEEPVFVEHVNANDKKVFSIKHAGTSEIKHIGKEISAGDGFEYYFAFVSKKTGELHWRPASLIQFQAVYKPSEELLNGINFSHTPKTDFTKNFTSAENGDKWAKRRLLTAEFGSLKKNKFLESSIRRQVNEKSLITMEVPISKKELESKVTVDGTPNVSLLQQAQSSVLPLPNINVISPSEVYTFQQFLQDYKDENEFKAIQDEARKYFEIFDSLLKLKKSGIVEFAAKLVVNVLQLPDSEIRSVVALKMLTLSKIITLCFKDNQVSIGLKDLESIQMPPIILSKIRGEFFGESKIVRGQSRMVITRAEKEKIYAYFLCMVLLFSGPDYTIPIEPLKKELKFGELIATKLLQGLGCVIISATNEQQIMYNTLQMAHLIGPPSKTRGIKRGRFSGSRK